MGTCCCLGGFKPRGNHSLRGVTVSGQSASADVKEAEEFLETLGKRIADFLPEQILSMGETSLSWERVSERTFIHEEAKSAPGFKALCKDRLAVLLGGKPFVVWQVRTLGPYSVSVSAHTTPPGNVLQEPSYVTPDCSQQCETHLLTLKTDRIQKTRNKYIGGLPLCFSGLFQNIMAF